VIVRRALFVTRTYLPSFTPAVSAFQWAAPSPPCAMLYTEHPYGKYPHDPVSSFPRTLAMDPNWYIAWCMQLASMI
jgi:hypothetical protein